MAKKNMKPNGKHLKEEDRAFIAESLQAGITFKVIAKLLVKDPSTIAKEVKTNRVFQSAPSFNTGIVNLCIHRKGGTMRGRYIPKHIPGDPYRQRKRVYGCNALEQSTFSDNCRTKLFYCDPYSSYQKGGIEKNHEYIRWVLPKRRSFDDLTWYDVALLASHINAIARDSLDGLTPYKASNPSLLNRIDLMKIEPLEVNLTPSLLSQK